MRSIAIVSGKGGAGKTTTAINLGISLSKLGKSVTIVDANVSTPDVALSLGAPVVPVALQHVLSNRAKAENAVYRHHSGTKILPSSLSFKENVEFSLLKGVINDLKKTNDFVLIDCAAGINNETRSVIESADECLIVTNPEMPALSSALKTIMVARQLDKKITGIIVTKIGKNGIEEKNIMALLENDILGNIPYDDGVRDSLMKRDALVSVNPKNKVSKEYGKIAKRISNSYGGTAFDRFIDIMYDLKEMIE
ncbi:MAG: AAA family ATPase [Nanoarchaeota archaeon]|nr:AAA family ATPase [Nanoarchaeota archaeon]